VVAHFTAFHGPDRVLIGSFDLKTDSSAHLGEMMDLGVKRIDQLYADALANGRLRADPSLVIEAPVALEELPPTEDTPAVESTDNSDTPEVPTGVTTNITIQFDTPDVGSVSSAENAVKGVPGIKSAQTSSLALGGTSVMKVSFAGDIGLLKLALQARGFKVDEGVGVLRIKRAAPRAIVPVEDSGK
jgi:hypothetical protein